MPFYGIISVMGTTVRLFAVHLMLVLCTTDRFRLRFRDGGDVRGSDVDGQGSTSAHLFSPGYFARNHCFCTDQRRLLAAMERRSSKKRDTLLVYVERGKQ